MPNEGEQVQSTISGQSLDPEEAPAGLTVDHFRRVAIGEIFRTEVEPQLPNCHEGETKNLPGLHIIKLYFSLSSMKRQNKQRPYF